jgi:hypothetical protein
MDTILSKKYKVITANSAQEALEKMTSSSNFKPNPAKGEKSFFF